jgi:hypothetical protein
MGRMDLIKLQESCNRRIFKHDFREIILVGIPDVGIRELLTPDVIPGEVLGTEPAIRMPTGAEKASSYNSTISPGVRCYLIHRSRLLLTSGE